MSRVFSQASDDISFALGIGGNLYVWTFNKNKLIDLCKQINKSPSSVYFNKKHKCWVIRMKSERHKLAFLKVNNSKNTEPVCKTEKAISLSS